MNYAQEQRLRMIEFILMHFSSVNRKHIMDFYGIAEACATRDFQVYSKLCPGNWIYSAPDRAYIKTPSFEPHFSW